MNNDNVETIPDEQMNLLDELQVMLEKQIKLVRQGNISSLEYLSKKTDALVEKIVQTGVCALPEFKNRREHLQKLYEELCLAIADQKADVTEKLSHVRKGKKTIAIYRSNI